MSWKGDIKRMWAFEFLILILELTIKLCWTVFVAGIAIFTVTLVLFLVSGMFKCWWEEMKKK